MGNDRTLRDVFDDHLRVSKDGTVEEDLARNYSPELVVLTGRGIFRGHDGMRQLAARLRHELPNVAFEYCTRLVDGEVAFLQWKAIADGARVEDGADSYVIRDGRIVVQTIHYTVQSTPAHPEGGEDMREENDQFQDQRRPRPSQR
jgi:hypothetical protein